MRRQLRIPFKFKNISVPSKLTMSSTWKISYSINFLPKSLPRRRRSVKMKFLKKIAMWLIKNQKL
jgi:hypothetical protein